ncbi:MAG: hypothetical protein ACLT98_13645 [Eggerthellaceae bacterium]
MKLPIDVMAVSGSDGRGHGRSIPLCVPFYDDTAPADRMAYVRSSFASASPQARVSVNYFTDGSAVFDTQRHGGHCCGYHARSRSSPLAFAKRRSRHGGNDAARACLGNGAQAGFPIPEGDLLSPV